MVAGPKGASHVRDLLRRQAVDDRARPCGAAGARGRPADGELGLAEALQRCARRAEGRERRRASIRASLVGLPFSPPPRPHGPARHGSPRGRPLTTRGRCAAGPPPRIRAGEARRGAGMRPDAGRVDMAGAYAGDGTRRAAPSPRATRPLAPPVQRPYERTGDKSTRLAERTLREWASHATDDSPSGARCHRRNRCPAERAGTGTRTGPRATGPRRGRGRGRRGQETRRPRGRHTRARYDCPSRPNAPRCPPPHRRQQSRQCVPRTRRQR